MTKPEFLEELKSALMGEVSAEVMMDSYRYYSNYIDEEVQKGRTEEDVLDELGLPGLIARSIIAAQSGDRAADVEYTEDGKTKKVRRKSVSPKKESTEKTHREFVFDFNAWYARVLFTAILIILIFIVYFILRLGFWFLITFGIPILIILGIIYLIMYFMQ